MKKYILFLFLSFPLLSLGQSVRKVSSFNDGWKFYLGDVANGQDFTFADNQWRELDLPHDYSIEGEFKRENPAKPEGGALPGGIGWYRKTFKVEAKKGEKKYFIDFDGIYQRSDVWINGKHLGYRPNGYISFRYDLTPYLNYNGQNNVIAVKTDNSHQPNSRWYSGSGIYRNVWLVETNKTFVDHWGTYVTTPKVSEKSAEINVALKINNEDAANKNLSVSVSILDKEDKVLKVGKAVLQSKTGLNEMNFNLNLDQPKLWSIDQPYLYTVRTQIKSGNKLLDQYDTPLGVRFFEFNSEKGFLLNGKQLKINGVCNHHDLGALGSAVNKRALERQLQILKAMGVNGIRTTHNPPAPELLDLCDKMGFIVMDESFDVWELGKERFDYHIFFKEWHKRDLEDHILRDRNHPSVFIWSIGNEIEEQTNKRGGEIAKELYDIVKNLDTTRPITTANNNPGTDNQIIQSGANDIIGYNYHHKDLPFFLERYPGKKFIGSETTSALETRGFYDMPSDIIRRWGGKDSTQLKNPDWTASSYDNVSAPWGSTHEETLKIIKKYDFLSGMYIWTGFDYLGEPTPYGWPARSSYFGIVDLAGIPKDVYYMYKSEWTKDTVLHVFPHWNWEPGKIVDMWAYYNNADEVELFLNGKSFGIKKKKGDDLHLLWRLKFEPGTILVVSRKNGVEIARKEIKTAGAPAKIILEADRKDLDAYQKDMSFITVKVVDKDGNLVPNATNNFKVKVSGPGFVAGIDNGNPISHDSMKDAQHDVFHGKAVAIIEAKPMKGVIKVEVSSDNLQGAEVQLNLK